MPRNQPMKAQAAEPTAEADRGRHPGFPNFNVLAGGPRGVAHRARGRAAQRWRGRVMKSRRFDAVRARWVEMPLPLPAALASRTFRTSAKLRALTPARAEARVAVAAETVD